MNDSEHTWTVERILELVARVGVVDLPYEAYWALFPGRRLNSDEIAFKVGFARSSDDLVSQTGTAADNVEARWRKAHSLNHGMVTDDKINTPVAPVTVVLWRGLAGCHQTPEGKWVLGRPS